MLPIGTKVRLKSNHSRRGTVMKPWAEDQSGLILVGWEDGKTSQHHENELERL